jgi:hypothetical protein
MQKFVAKRDREVACTHLCIVDSATRVTTRARENHLHTIDQHEISFQTRACLRVYVILVNGANVVDQVLTVSEMNVETRTQARDILSTCDNYTKDENITKKS